MKKYLFYTFLALCMIPAGSLKAQSGPDEEENPGGIILDKQVSEENEDGGYTITLDAYATGTKITTITEKMVPCDIVLVLDHSGSMSNNNVSNAPGGRLASTQVLDDNTTRYIKINGTLYYLKRVQYNSNYHWIYRAGSDPTRNNHAGEIYTGQQLTVGDNVIYTKRNSATRLEVLRDAVASFVNTVYENNPTEGDKHSISVVWYGTYTKSTTYLSTNGDNYSLIPLTSKSVCDGLRNTLLTEYPNSNQTGISTSTYCNLGLEKAYDVLYAAANDGHNKIVVFFTDGEPGSNAGKFAEVTARSSIEQSNRIKSDALTNRITDNGKTTSYPSRIYAIGLMTGGTADYHNTNTGSGEGPQVTNDKYRFMHYTSSNYDVSGQDFRSYKFNKDLSVKCLSPLANGSACAGHGSEDPHGYFTKSDGTDLSTIFATIATEASTGGATVNLDETSVVVVDVMSNYFLLPEGVETKDIKTYTAQCNGVDGNGQFTFGTPVAQNFTVSVKPDTREVDVMGFDFADNYVFEDTGKTPTEYGGKKLIIEIPIVVDPANPGGANLVTNNKALSGVYTGGQVGADGKITYEDKFAGFPKPMVVKPNIVIKKWGLRNKGESATFKIERVADQNGGAYTGADNQPFYVSLTQTKNYDSHEAAITLGNELTTKVKLLDYGWYRVTETSWSSWYTPAAKTIDYLRVNPDYPATSSEPTITDENIKYGTDSDGCPYLIRYVGKETEMAIGPAKTLEDGEIYYSVGTNYEFVNELIIRSERDPEKYSEAVVINKFGTDGSSNPVNK